jgi:YetA-like protein
MCAALSACGAGSGVDSASNAAVSASTSGPATTAGSLVTNVLNGPITTTVTPPGTPAGSNNAVQTSVTTVQLTSSATSSQTNPAATFGQVFAQGDVPDGQTLVGKTASGATVPLQVDVKARHPDGSLRHAVVTVQLPGTSPKQAETVTLYRTAATAAATSQASPATLLSAGFSASVNLTVAGVRYTASADELLKSGKVTSWLAGPLVNEWIVSAPLKDASGKEDPHLMAQFAIRFYTGSKAARVDVSLENDWAYDAAPQNVTYDAQILVGGQPVYTQAALTHYHHARWRKVYWWGTEPKLDVRHNLAYLLATKALPNYDQSLTVKEATITSWTTQWNNSKTGPMNPGVGQPYMPTTGARSDIGLMPAWNALYLLSMDPRMKDIALGMSEQAGSWSAHYRDKNTGRPVTLADYPYATPLNAPGDSTNPATKKPEMFPVCPTAQCTTPMTADTSHQAAFSYVPYLVTGDYYHLEELQFWANFSSISSSPPGYRQGGKGLVKSDQVRGQAWSLRTLAEAAYITPDNDPQKANFTAIVNNNIDWYDANYTNNPSANKLGALDHGYAIVYDDSTGLAPWQDDFFTSAIGHMVELGFTRAQPLLTWKSKFVVDRMVGDGYCWIEAPAYSMKVRDSATAPVYSTIGQVYQANFPASFTQLACAGADMAANLKLRVGDMVGYVTAVSSQSIMRPALAYAAGVNANGKKAWDLYAKRPYQPDYAAEPEFAILPR